MVSFFFREVERCSVYRSSHIVIIEWILSEEVVLDCPMDEGVKTRHETVEGVATSRFRQAAFWNSFICLLKKGICYVRFPVFTNLDELMLGSIVIVEIPQEVCGQSLKSDLLPRINLVSFERP